MPDQPETLGTMLRDLECGKFPRHKRGGTPRAPGAGADVFERHSIFYHDWRSRPVLAFCSHKPHKPLKHLSNWFQADFIFQPCQPLEPFMLIPMQPRSYRTAEQAIMHCKASIFNDRYTFELIGDAYEHGRDERYLKDLGRQVQNFDEDLWQRLLLPLAVSVLLQKFQLPDLQRTLLATESAILVEAAHYDSQWGVLLPEEDPNVHDLERWQGWNVLGEALMIVRHHMRTEEPIWQQRFFSTPIP